MVSDSSLHQELASIESVSRQKSNGRRQLSVAGVLAYTAVWALIISLFREAIKLKEGTHTLAEAQLSDMLMLIITGLLFVAIGVVSAVRQLFVWPIRQLKLFLDVSSVLVIVFFHLQQ